MKESVFLQHCDPRQNFGAYKVLALINLHALLLKEVVIQDNFLISQLFFNIYKISPNHSFSKLFSEKVLNIASRNNLGNSILNLKADLLTKAKNDLYIPFEGKPIGLELYNDSEFCKYLKTIEKSTASLHNQFKHWSPVELGKNLRKLMYESAIDNTSGIESDQALEILNQIDSISIENNGYHSRSLYYKYLNEIDDPVHMLNIKTWIDIMYLKNLPDSLSIGISVPSRQLENDFQFNHLDVLDNPNNFNETSKLGEIDGAFLNIDFLANLHPASIIEIRDFKEFSQLQTKIESGATNEISKSLTVYLSRVSSEAPRYYEPYRKKIKKLESLKAGKVWLTEALDYYNIITFEPVSQKIAGVLSLILKKINSIDKKIDETLKLSEVELKSKKVNTLIRNISDVIHKVD